MTKIEKAKAKVAAKVAKGKAKCKAKVTKKCAALLAVVGLGVLCGCQNPAQRAQTAETTQKFYVYEGATANFTFGSEFVSLAQSNETGGNDAGLTASPTTETKPEIAVGVGGSSAGVGQQAGASSSGTFSRIGAAVDAVSSLIPAATNETKAAGPDANGANAANPDTKSDCSKCSDGSCEVCTDCEY